MKANSIALLLFAFFWCGMMALIDYLAGREFVRQLRSAGFPTTPGRVVSSEVKVTRTSKGGRNYQPVISFAYTVDGRHFTSTRLAFTSVNFSARGSSGRTVAEYPPGREVTVFYDPQAPADAILRPGFLPEHLIIALFMTPHHMVGVGLLFAALAGLFGSRRVNPLRHETDLRMIVRMPGMSPLLAAIIALGASAFVSIFLVFLLVRLPPSMTEAALVWALVLGIAGAVYLRQRGRIAAGMRDLVIDAGARTVTLPAASGRRERLTLPFDDVERLRQKVLPRQSTRTTKHGWKITTKHGSERYELLLETKGGESHSLVTSADKDGVTGIGEALERTVGWPLARV